MTKKVYYTYLGTNGTITTPIHLEDIYYIRTIQLTADEDCSLTKDGQNFVKVISVPDNEVELWVEVKDKD